MPKPPTQKFSVDAFWDDDARVWYATSDDVRGLAIEAHTFDVLLERLKTIVPELLECAAELRNEPHPTELAELVVSTHPVSVHC